MTRRMDFMTSAAGLDGYPTHEAPEIIILGRSNSGKSSLINAVSHSDIAKVSKQPGKTQLLNFFSYGDAYVWVDVPGYGFSRRSGQEQKKWRSLIENYVYVRNQLVGGLILMDGRRDWTEDESSLVDWLRTFRPDLTIALVLTKADQLTKNQLQKKIAVLKKQSNLPVLPCSSSKGTGIDELEDYIYSEWIKGIHEAKR
jgi:GTP-binding protein